MYMKYKTLRFLSLLFLAVIVSVGARAAADSHNPYTAEAKRYDKQPSEKVMEAAKKLADAGDSQKAIILYTLVCRRFRADMPEKEKQTCILAHVEVSKLYITSASYIKALDLGVEGVKLSEECEKQPHVAKLYNLIGNAYTYFLDYEKGMNYYKKALAFCRKYPDRETEYKILCNMTNLCVQQHNLKEANRYYKMSERVRDHKNDLATYMSSYTQGRIEMGRGIYAKQIARYRHLADYAEKHKLPAKFTCYAFEQIYLCFREMHQNDSVVKYLHVCYETAKRKGVLFHFTGAIRSLANHYDEVGDIAKANDYKTQYIAIEDSSKNTREFDMMKNKLFLHEVEQTTKEIDTLHEKEQAGKRTIRQQQAVIAGITIVCLCVCIFFFVIYRQKRKLNDATSTSSGKTRTTSRCKRKWSISTARTPANWRRRTSSSPSSSRSCRSRARSRGRTRPRKPWENTRTATSNRSSRRSSRRRSWPSWSRRRNTARPTSRSTNWPSSWGPTASMSPRSSTTRLRKTSTPSSTPTEYRRRAND